MKIPDYIPTPIPKCRLTGPVFIAEWRTHDEGYHALVARRREQLLPLMRAAIEKTRNEIPEVKRCFRGEAVLPPAWMVDILRRQMYEHLIDTLKDKACAHASTYAECGRRLPLPFRKCQTYLPPENYMSTDAFNQKLHIRCQNCDSLRIQLADKTWEQLLDERLDLHQPPSKPLAGRVATDDARLLALADNFGHHSHGLQISEVEPGAWSRHTPILLVDNWVIDNFAELKNETEAELERVKKAKKSKDEKRDRERRERDEKNLKAAMKFFREG